MARILMVEDDLTFSTMLRTWLGKKGFAVETAGRVADAVKLLCGEGVSGKSGAGERFDLILSDMRLPDHDGLRLLEWLHGHGMDIPFIVMTSYAEVQNAVLAMKAGAIDYIAKPLQPDVLLQKINDALGAPKTKPDAGVAQSAAFIEGTSEAARRLYGYVSLVAPTPMSVLIMGASGTGKENVARRIHGLSRRADGPFVAIDCGAVPREVAASEFFGHVKGAFTGAVADKRGAFVAADGGTLFLDEVGNLSYDVQVQLLRALQEHRVRPVGSVSEQAVDFRLVCATNENLAAAVERGAFREDLYHRINEFTVQMPELKDRGEDLFLFADHFLRQANSELGRNVCGFAPEAAAMLARHTWPGNLRELKNVVKRAVLLNSTGYISRDDLELSMPPATAAATVTPLHDAEGEAGMIKNALAATGGNKSRAAQLLGIDRKTLYNKIDKYRITH